MGDLKLSIVLSTHNAQFEALAYKGDFENNITKIARWGYEGVELAIRDPGLVDIEILETVLIKNGLQVPAIGTGQAWGEERLSFTNPDVKIRNSAITRIKSHIQLAKRLKALVIIGLIRGITPAGQSKQQSMEYLLNALLDCSEDAASHGVKLAIEPLNRYETDLIHTVVEGLEIVDSVGLPSLGLLLDTFHMNIEERVLEESIRLCGSKIFHFHVADSNRWYPGGGHMDFKSILDTLRSTGYQGWISGEFMPMPDPDTAASRGITHLREILIKEESL